MSGLYDKDGIDGPFERGMRKGIKQSRRQELLDFMETGRLRGAVAGRLSVEAQDLLIDIVARYCEGRRRRHA